MVGCSAPAEVSSNLEHLAGASSVPPALWAAAKQRGLLPAAIPVPTA